MWRRTTIVAGLALALALAPGGSALAGPASRTGPVVSFSPTKGLRTGDVVHVTVTGAARGDTLLALECSSVAVSIGEDGCENRVNSAFFATGSRATTTLAVTSTLTTAVGSVDCLSPKAECLAAVVQLSNGNSISILGVAPLSFVAGSAGPLGSGPPAPPVWRSPPGVPAGVEVTPSHADSVELTAGLAPSLTSAAAVTGPGTSLAPVSAPPTPVTGAGLIQLVLAAPGTSWASSTRTSVTVDVTVGSAPTEQIVCFAGSRPFTYAAVLGRLETGRTKVTIAVAPELSADSATPVVRVVAARLSVVARTNPAYLEMAYAPIVYGRPDTAESDTPLLTYVSSSPGPDGSTDLEYTTIWSKEDAGTSFVPFLEWGEWGRMTDVTETVALEVTRSGAIEHPSYDSCGCSASFPVNRTSPEEEEVAFTGRRFGTHLIVRNASGNDYQSETGTSAYRMEQAPVPGPAPGAARETVMDANPWTYRISAEELSRWYADGSTAPSSPEIGDSRQYGLVDVDTDATGTSAIAVAIRLHGSSTWYRNDFGSGYALYDGGHSRTAVKLPIGWQATGIAAVHLVAYPDAAHWSVSLVSFRLLGLTDQFGIVTVTAPRPAVVKG